MSHSVQCHCHNITLQGATLRHCNLKYRAWGGIVILIDSMVWLKRLTQLRICFHVSSLDKVTRIFTTSEIVVTSIAEQCVYVS